MNVTYIAISEKDFNALRQPDRYLSAKSAAQMFDVSPDFIEQLAKAGKINAWKIPGHSVTRYKYSEIETQFKSL